ncbi:hypothetical protein E1287_27255 [Actinomadura sp. KC06]|uniref:ATP synthase F0 subunit B n=1 Tax=Actinomadura sp. KC06 TaxID=2530369 RepID=UPI00104AB605|nr:ATP synthase F0 subunit B [Actinomadura sp. KC06]TDD31216.1 hypothetical protein E1287_27255 [Actinomadura sp. KC06]
MSDHNYKPDQPTSLAPNPSKTEETRQELLAYARDIDDVVTRHLTKEAVAARRRRVLQRAQDDDQNGGGEPDQQAASPSPQALGCVDTEPSQEDGQCLVLAGRNGSGKTLTFGLLMALLSARSHAQRAAQEFEDAALRNAATITRRARERAEAMTARAQETEQTALRALQEAQRKSEQIVSEAERKAVRILDEARSEADMIKTCAHIQPMQHDPVLQSEPQSLNRKPGSVFYVDRRTLSSFIGSNLALAIAVEDVRGQLRPRRAPLLRTLKSWRRAAELQALPVPRSLQLAGVVLESMSFADTSPPHLLEEINELCRIAFPAMHAVYPSGSFSRCVRLAPVADDIDILIAADFTSLEEEGEAGPILVEPHPKRPPRLWLPPTEECDGAYLLQAVQQARTSEEGPTDPEQLRAEQQGTATCVTSSGRG